MSFHVHPLVYRVRILTPGGGPAIDVFGEGRIVASIYIVHKSFISIACQEGRERKTEEGGRGNGKGTGNEPVLPVMVSPTGTTLPPAKEKLC